MSGISSRRPRLAWLATASIALVVSPGHAQSGAVFTNGAGAVHASVAVGSAHTVAILSDGAVITWGENDRGQLGRGTIDRPNIRREIDVLPGITSAVTAAAGEAFNLLLLADGSVLSWGANQEGQLGLGPAGVMPRAGQPMPDVATPTRVPGLAKVTAIAAGARFALALLEDGTVVAWGDGAMGALGDGKGVGTGQHYAVPFPRPVVGLSRVAAIAAGSEFGLALGSDGSVWGWGANQYGQMGDDAVDFKAAPVAIAGLSGVRSLHGGARTAFALLDSGTVVAWGRNDCDVLGMPTRQLAKTSQPRPIAGLSGVEQMAAALTTCHAVARLSDGTARAWGYDGFGQLGPGPETGGIYTLPLEGGAAVFAGGNRSHFLMTDGRLFTTGFRMADLNDRVPREVAHLDGSTARARCAPPAGPPAGGWSTTGDEVEGGSLAKTDQAAALKKADAFRALLTSVYTDAVRIEGRAHRFVGPARVGPAGVSTFGFLTRYLGSVCDPATGRVREEGSTRSEAVIAANDLGPILEAFGEPIAIGGGPVQLFHAAPRAATIGGLPAFEVLGGRAVLVTRDGQLPFVPVTRAEYLDLIEQHGQAQGSQGVAGIDEAVKRLEEEIAQVRKELEGPMRDTVVAEMVKALEEARAQAPQTRASPAAGAGEDVALVRKYRASASPEELSRPAVIESFGFAGSFADEGRMVVRLTPTALTGDSPRHRVQLLTMSWSWAAGHPQDETWRSRVETTFPFERLKGLLDP